MSTPLRTAVIIGSTGPGRFGPVFDATGRPTNPAAAEAAVHTMLDDLVWWATARRAARARDTADASVDDEAA